MHRFIYVSHPAGDMGAEILSDISATANARNRRDDLTGVLMWSKSVFFQMLEGPTVELDATISRITADTRHSGMVHLAYREVSRITCGNWDMGCFPLQGSGFPFVPATVLTVEAIAQRVGSIPDTELDDFFRTFYRNNINRIKPR